MLYIGTSGYSYPDWRGPFYPKSLAAKDYLPYYSRHFNTVEINYTYYRPPDRHTMARMLANSSGRVLFSIKANREMTHERVATAETYQRFIHALEPLAEAGVLGAVLFQFPYSFHHTPKNVDYLKGVRDLLPDMPLVVEFRQARWIRQETFELLKELEMGFCCVDEPALKGLVPPVVVVTSNPAYLRFHGRNSQKWFNHEKSSERYDYLYSSEELQEWVPKIKKMADGAENTLVYMNNHFTGKAVQNANMLIEALEI